MDTISAWDIYWVMQADTIGNSAIAFGSVLGFISVCAIVIGTCESMPKTVSYGKRLIAIAIPLFLLGVFTPTSKTAAAMYVIPAIANNEAIQREASDLYRLAKSGLEELVKPDTTKPAPKSN